nr:immunoglobulin light chain junction region [Macaca mulatta]
CQQETKWIFTF